MGAAWSDDAALPRAERLRAHAEFQELFRHGARLEREGFILLWMPARGRRAAAFAASRRLGGSVVRNRARRRLREAYRRQKGLVPRTGVRLCFIARRKSVETPFTDLLGEIAGALRHAAARLAS